MTVSPVSPPAPAALRRVMRPFSVPWLLLVVLLCIAVRLTVLVAFPAVFAFDETGIIQGNAAHDTHANNLLHLGIFGNLPGVPDADFPPLYVFVNTAVYGTIGRGYMQVGLVQTLCDVLSIVMLYEISKRLMPHGKPVGLLAGVLYALYPYLVFQNLTLVETALFMTILHALVLLMVLLRERTEFDRQTWALIILAGVDLGLGLLTRPIILPLMAFVGVWFLFRLSLKQSVLRLTPVVIISLLIITPWIIRNYSVFNTLVLVSTNSGENFWFGNSSYTIPYLEAGYHPSFPPTDQLKPGLTRPQASAEMFQLGFNYLRQNPGQIVPLAWAKFLAYWSIDVFPRVNPSTGDDPIANYSGVVRVTTDAQGKLLLDGVPAGDAITEYATPLFDQIGRTVHRWYFGPLLLLALIGVALTVRAWRQVSLLWFVQLCMTVLYVVFNPATRYRVPTDPMLFVFSAYTLVILWRYLNAIRSRRSAPLSAQAAT